MYQIPGLLIVIKKPGLQIHKHVFFIENKKQKKLKNNIKKKMMNYMKK